MRLFKILLFALLLEIPARNVFSVIPSRDRWNILHVADLYGMLGFFCNAWKFQ